MTEFKPEPGWLAEELEAAVEENMLTRFAHRACKGLTLSPDVKEGAVFELVRRARDMRERWENECELTVHEINGLFDALKELETE